MLKNSFRRSPQPTIYTPSFELLWFMHVQLVPIMQKSLRLINWSTRSPPLNLNLFGTIFTTQPSEGQPCQFLIPLKKTPCYAVRRWPGKQSQHKSRRHQPNLRVRPVEKKNRFDMARCTLQKINMAKITMFNSWCIFKWLCFCIVMFVSGEVFWLKMDTRKQQMERTQACLFGKETHKKQWIETGDFL